MLCISERSTGEPQAAKAVPPGPTRPTYRASPSFSDALRIWGTGDLTDLCEDVAYDRAYVRHVQALLDELATKANDSEHLGAIADEADVNLKSLNSEANRNPAHRSLALAYFTQTTRSWRNVWAIRNAEYRTGIDHAYPVRDVYGCPLRILRIAPNSMPVNGRTDAVRSSTEVKPYIRSSITGAERARLYDRYLECKRLEPSDVSAGSRDAALIGQYDVRARVDLPANTCIGVYGGRFLTRSQAEFAGDSTYLMSCAPQQTASKNRFVVVDGENTPTRINSLFDVDATGRAATQAKTGYNVVQNGFHAVVQTPSGEQDISLSALFTTRAVKQGTSLRLTYGYSPEQVRRRITHADGS